MDLATDNEKELAEIFLKILNSERHVIFALDPDNGELLISKTIPAEDAVLFSSKALWSLDD